MSLILCLSSDGKVRRRTASRQNGMIMPSMASSSWWTGVGAGCWAYDGKILSSTES